MTAITYSYNMTCKICAVIRDTALRMVNAFFGVVETMGRAQAARRLMSMGQAEAAKHLMLEGAKK